jgi:Transglycosylase SLT domain
MRSAGTHQRQIKVVFAFAVVSFQFALACSLSAELETALHEAALSYGLEPALLQALVYQESRYCTDALSPKGAIGLGQLMPATAQALGVDPNDPVQNLSGAAAYLREQWDSFEDWTLALAAYNAGPGAVIKYQGVPPYEETQNYVVSILSRYTALVDALPDSSLVEVAATPTQLTSVLDATKSIELPDSAVMGEEAAPDVVLAEGLEVEKPKPAIMIIVTKRPDPTKIPIMVPTNKDAGLTIFNNE